MQLARYATPVQFIILVTTIVSMVLCGCCWASRLGKAIRAVADNPELAEACGINSNS